MTELSQFGYGDRVLLLDGRWSKVIGFAGSDKKAVVRVEGQNEILTARMQDVRILEKAPR